jgi:phosphoglucosamine mutase
MGLRFGTDGVRGAAAELTDAFVFALGEAAARILGTTFVVGRDTRESGQRIERALVAGLERGGAVVSVLGVAPTPAVAWLAARDTVCGAVISASHNPWFDNGIKFFGPGGRKLSDEVEAELERLLDELLDERARERVDQKSGTPGNTAPQNAEVREDGGESTNESFDPAAALEAWTESLLAAVSVPLDGLHVVIDCANGAQSAIAAGVISGAGARVDVLHASPDGRNINAACGSTHPGDLQAAVVASGAHLGLAFDGDADRLLAVDEQGGIVDGDHLLALFAADLHARGELRGDLVVVTVMTNLGFRIAMEELGIEVVETAVGDRYVLEALARLGGSLGGEQSGHIVFAELATTGDGLLSGLQLLDLLQRSDRPFSELAVQSMTQLPQVLRNVAVAQRRTDIAELLAVQIAEEQVLLGTSGRILLRPSGTEPLIRVMVEAATEALASQVAGRLAAAVEEVCSA